MKKNDSPDKSENAASNSSKRNLNKNAKELQLNISAVKKSRESGGANACSRQKLTSNQRKQLVALVLEALKKEYPAPRCALEYGTPFELLVAVILSAQCTDKRVNMVLPGLFKRFPDAKALAEAKVEDIEQEIKTCGLYRSKAANLSKTSKTLVEKFDGNIPSDFKSLVSLPGVGRKTANCVLGNAFGIPSGFVVDAHVLRLSRRIGFTDETTPEKVEDELNRLTPQEEWIDFSHRLIYLGRQHCVARSPKCQTCPISSLCLKRL